MSQIERIDFPGGNGEMLAARLERPAGTPKAYALFAHCFTCTKDIFAASRIAGALAAKGYAVLRFDFTGLGGSDGEFANTNFSSNLADLEAAADYLREHHQAPKLLVGHSLGGAAVLAAAADIPEARAVATINAPADPKHVLAHFTDHQTEEIAARGEAEVEFAGRPFRIKKQFLDDIAEHDLSKKIGNLKRALLVMHAPRDQTVGVENASAIYGAAKHPKSFISLDDADHLLSRWEDSAYAAAIIAAWAERYLESDGERDTWPKADHDSVVVAETGEGRFGQAINVAGRHRLRADEPAEMGGLDTGPSPYDYLLAGLGACTAMTLRMYADHKGLPLEHVSVSLRHGKIHAEDCQDCETKSGKIDQIEREVTIKGDKLTAEQRKRLLEIADRCPVHRTLHEEVKVVTREGEG